MQPINNSSNIPMLSYHNISIKMVNINRFIRNLEATMHFLLTATEGHMYSYLLKVIIHLFCYLDLKLTIQVEGWIIMCYELAILQS